MPWFDHWVYYPILLTAFTAYTLSFQYYFDLPIWRNKQAQSKPSLLLIDVCLAALPLLGLLGTISGLLDTFAAMAISQLDTASMMTSGIGTALGTTQLGLLLAIVGYVLKRIVLSNTETRQNKWVNT